MGTHLIVGLCVLLASVNGYVLKPQQLFTVGRAQAGEYFWQPSKAVAINNVGLLRVSRSKDGCQQSCGGAAVVFNEEGEFNVFEFNRFCGAGGVVGDDSITCFAEQLWFNESGVAIGLVRYQVHSDKQLTEQMLPVASFFNTGDLIPMSLQPGDNVVFFPEKKIFVCSGEIQLQNESRVHGFFRSGDGISWNLTSVVPFPFTKEATIHRLGETKLILIAGSPGNFTQATSVYLGSRWEKVENISYAAPLSTWSSQHHTTLYGGVRGRPGVTAMAAGPKKGSEKPIDITEWHNRLATKQSEPLVSNFSIEYKQTTHFDCSHDSHSNDDSDGCLSSSYVALTSINGSVFLFYDKLDNGFAASTETKQSAIHAIKVSLNETKEENELLAKIELQKKEAEREKQREEARAQAQRDAEERKRRERREKIRRDKIKRALFVEMDEVNIAKSAKHAELDGETIIVRDVDPEFVDIEKDTFFF